MMGALVLAMVVFLLWVATVATQGPKDGGEA